MPVVILLVPWMKYRLAVSGLLPPFLSSSSEFLLLLLLLLFLLTRGIKLNTMKYPLAMIRRKSRSQNIIRFLEIFKLRDIILLC